MTPLAWLRQLFTGILFPAAPDTATRVRPLSLLLVIVLPALLLYPCRDFMLLEPDEARYAQIPKEMAEGGSWIVPTLHDEPYLDKPPLMYWLVALSYKLFGVSEASARLVPALAVHLTVLAVYLLGRRSIGERGALWAALLLSAARIRWFDCLLFALVVVGVNLPWYVAMGIQQPEFLKYFFWEHNVMRFVKPFDHLQPVWYYVPILLAGFLPGVVVGIGYLRSVLKGEPIRSSAGGFWLLAGGWCVAFFSFSGSKLPTYILPAFPPLCLALGEYVARTKWNRSYFTRGMVGAFACLLAVVHYVALPWYAKERSPMGRPEIVKQFVDDPNVTVVMYPREVSSVAFYTGRRDLRPVRTKDGNRMINESHARPKTVILFTHNHSLHGFKETLRGAVDCKVRVTEEASLRRTGGPAWVNDLLGGGPWGLCDIAVIEPPKAGPKLVPVPTPPPPTQTKAKGSPFKPETDIAIADMELEVAFDESRNADDRDRLIDVARQRYQEALRKDPKNKAAHIGLAKLYSWADDKERAVATSAKVCELYPKDKEVAFAFVRVLVRFEDWPAAVKAAEKALALDPENRTYRKALGVCLAKAERWEDAFDQLKESMGEADARCFLGRIMLDVGRVSEGKQQFEEALRKDPKHETAKELLAEVQVGRPTFVPVEGRDPPK